jgi:hypothetical protein
MKLEDLPPLPKPERNCFIACSKEVVESGRCQCHSQFRCSSVLEKMKQIIKDKETEDYYKNIKPGNIPPPHF